MKTKSKVRSHRSLGFLAATLPLLTLQAFGASYPSTVQGDKPLAYYRFNESAERPNINRNSGSLGSAGDAVSVNVHTVNGGAIVGAHNAATYFDSTAHTIVPWNAALNPDASTSFTIEAWFMPTSDKVAGSFVGPAPINNRYSYSGVNRQGWVFFQRNPDAQGYGNGQTDVGWNFRTYIGSGGSTGISITSQKPYQLGKWQHVVVVYDAEAMTATMYIDGEKADAGFTSWSDPSSPPYKANTDDHDPAEAKNGPAGLSIGSYNNTEPGSNPFRGGVDEVALYSKALTAEQIKAHYDNAKDPARTVSYDGLVQSDGPVGYWRLDDPAPGPDVAVNFGELQSAGSAENTSEIAHPASGALVGLNDTAYAFHQRNGYSAVDLPWNAKMNPEATVPFTFEAWFRPTSDRQNPGAAPVNNRYVKSGNRTGWVIFQRAPNTSYRGVSGYSDVGWNFRFYTGTGGSGQDVTSNVPYTIGEWQHVVTTWDGVSTATMYINGVEAASSTTITYAANTSPGEDGDPANTADFAIGSYNRASKLGDNPFEGDIDEVAFYNVQLTPDQIAAHYAAGVDEHGSADYANLVLTAGYELADPKAQALQPVSYFRFNETAATAAGNSGTAGDLADGAVVVGAGAGTGPQSPAYPGFEASNAALTANGKSWVSLNNPSVLNLSGQLTVEAWIKPDATQGALARIVSHGPPTLSSYVTDTTPRDGAILLGNEVSLKINSTEGAYSFGTSDGTEAHGVSFPIPEGDLGSASWIHLVGTYDGTSWTLYRNGSPVATAADSVGALSVDNGGWGIGSTGNGWADAFAGGIDEVAIYGTALSASQVASHYGAATASGDKLSIARAGNTITLTYSGGILQESATVNGSFTDVAGAVSPLNLVAPVNTRFYRLRH